MRDRELSWDGCINVRDLGGLSTASGRPIRWGAVVRADHPNKLSEAGWRAAHDHGVRTIIELRTHGVDTQTPVNGPRPAGLTSLCVEIEDFTDEDFKARWAKTGLWSTPLYYDDALRRWPERHAEVVRAFAQAEPGAVLIHCGRGHDRTGIVFLLLLSLAGVAHEDIAADYDLSDKNMPEHERQALRDALARADTTAHEAILAVLDGFDVCGYLRGAGLDETTIDLARDRLFRG